MFEMPSNGNGLPFDTRRVRRWMLNPQQLMQYLQQLFNPNGIRMYRHFKCEALPEGFTVLGAFQMLDPYRLEFYIHHPSFDPVENLGEIPPVWGNDVLFQEEQVPYNPPNVNFIGGKDRPMLLCMGCGEDYTHISKAGTLQGSDKNEAIEAYSGTERIGDTGSRRSALQIEYSCEMCSTKNVLILQQHKGQTFIETNPVIDLSFSEEETDERDSSGHTSSGHEWEVYSTALADVVLMVRCRVCDTRGIVKDPTPQEWNRAFQAPTNPYSWEDKSRVTKR